jgi:transcriptional regulator with XRE-family HTH domain
VDVIRNFGANVRALRAIYQISRKKMAKDLKVSQSTIARWETGTIAPAVDDVVRIAHYFDVRYLTMLDTNPLIRTLE